LLNPFRIRSFAHLLARACVLLGVVVLVCVPGLTRIGQKLETASRAPSFAKNIDCPPRKVTVAPAPAVVSPVALTAFHLVPVASSAPAPDERLLHSLQLFGPRPLRAPPLTLLA
jgi:hypothetical protein